MDNAYRKFYILFFTFIYFDYAAYLFIQFFRWCWSLVVVHDHNFAKFDTITTCDAELNTQVCNQTKYNKNTKIHH